MSRETNLVLENSLQVFFYDLLQEFNKKSTNPLPNEMIYYSSLVMDQFGISNKYFEEVDGKIREKILGIKLLESCHMSKEKQKATVRDIGETALFLCGYFPDSMNKKIIDTRYYNEIGVVAYKRLNAFVPTAYNIPGFFSRMSKNFAQVTNLMSLVALKHEQSPDDFFLIYADKKAI